MASIQLDNVNVWYPIYSAAGRSFKGAVARKIGGAIGVDANSRLSVHALKDVNLKLASGARVAVFGANGSGKSTLLKVLSGIYEPTSGRARVQGRVSSLLDMSMGMDIEATGYENVVMRSAFLGATFREARQVVPEIENFSELGDFMALPLRTYSDGMKIRLAFAISTAFSPEILVMDEHVGAADASFAAKAKHRLEQLAQSARILVLATHDPEAARRFCSDGLVLEQGEVRFFGAVEEALAYYSGP